MDEDVPERRGTNEWVVKPRGRACVPALFLAVCASGLVCGAKSSLFKLAAASIHRWIRHEQTRKSLRVTAARLDNGILGVTSPFCG